MPLYVKPHRGGVVVGMSGGMDSTVAAWLLAEEGYSVVGVTLKLYCYARSASSPRPCCSDVLVRRAGSFCASRNIPHRVIDVEDLFERTVVRDFLSNYRSGRTPNPCIVCNEKVKFPALLHAADELGLDFVATGHYAAVARGSKAAPFLRVARDDSKDQSYFLYRLNSAILRRAIFPLGDLSRREVSEIAADIGLRSESYRSSQDVCFVPDGDLRRFLEERLGKHPGPILDIHGRVIGTHSGIHCATIGQRKRLGLATGVPMYVAAIDAERNAIIVAPKDRLFQIGAVCGRLRLRTRDLRGPLSARVRYRRSFAQVAEVRPGPSSLEVFFEEPQWAVTPGQSLVLYREGLVLGGGIIEQGIAAR